MEYPRNNPEMLDHGRQCNRGRLQSTAATGC